MWNKTQPVEDRKVSGTDIKFVVVRGGKVIEEFTSKQGAEVYARNNGGTVKPA